MRCAGTGATAQDEGTFGEWLDELPSEVAAANARLLKRTKGTKAPPRRGGCEEARRGGHSLDSRRARDRKPGNKEEASRGGGS